MKNKNRPMKNKNRAIRAIAGMRTEKMRRVAKFWINNPDEFFSAEDVAEKLETTEKSAKSLTEYLLKYYGFVFKVSGKKKYLQYSLVNCNYGKKVFINPTIPKLQQLALGINLGGKHG